MGAVYSFALARYSEELGIRRLGLAASILFPMGLYVMPAYAVSTNSMPAIIFSHVIFGGLGFYSSYPQIPPHLTKWFPDCPGTALSLYFSAFGSAVLVATPIVTQLLSYFRRTPTRLCALGEMPTTINSGGERFAHVNGEEVQVIAATARDLAASGFRGVEEGLFLLDGSNGVCETMVRPIHRAKHARHL